MQGRLAGSPSSAQSMNDTVICHSIFGNTVQVPREKLRFRPAVYAIVVHENKILLLTSRSTGLLALPGGGIELGEPTVEALKRELMEETGIRVDNGRFLYADDSFFYYDPSDNAYHALRFLYDCKPLNFNLVADEDVEDGENKKPRWYDIANLTAERFLFFGTFVVDYLNNSMAEGRGLL